MLTPYYSDDLITIYHGEALGVLLTLEGASVDALITDPPYSSGGFTRGDRTADPSEKYCQNGETLGRPSFSGDNRDQHAFEYWCALWLTEGQRIVKPGGYGMVFTDWRQLPVTTDALQAGGFVWRGIIAWDKGRGARAPHKGYFRHQCEYIVWGSNGPLPVATHDGPYDGCIRETVDQADKFHMTGKPTAVMGPLVKVVDQGGGDPRPVHGEWDHGSSGTDDGSAVHRYRARGAILRDSGHAHAAGGLALRSWHSGRVTGGDRVLSRGGA